MLTMATKGDILCLEYDGVDFGAPNFLLRSTFNSTSVGGLPNSFSYIWYVFQKSINMAYFMTKTTCCINVSNEKSGYCFKGLFSPIFLLRPPLHHNCSDLECSLLLS